MEDSAKSLESAEARASRVVAEMRQARNWSYGDLAKRMQDDARCNIDRSSLQKIEKATPPRKISLNELVAFSKVFEAPLTAFLGTDIDVESELTWSSLEHSERLAGIMLRAEREYRASIEPLQKLADRDTKFRERMKERYIKNLETLRPEHGPVHAAAIEESALLTTARDVLRGKIEPLGHYPLNLETGEPDDGQ